MINQQINAEDQEIESRPKFTLESLQLAFDQLRAKLKNGQIVEIIHDGSPSQLYNGKFPSDTIKSSPIIFPYEQKKFLDNILIKINEYLIRIGIWQRHNIENSQREKQIGEKQIIYFQLLNSLFLQNKEDVCEFTLEEITAIDLNKLVLIFNYQNIENNPFKYFTKDSLSRWLIDKTSYPNRTNISWENDLAIIFKGFVNENGDRSIQAFCLTMQEFKDFFSSDARVRKNKIIEYISSSKYEIIISLLDNDVIENPFTPEDINLLLKKILTSNNVNLEIFNWLKKMNASINSQELEIICLVQYLIKPSSNLAKLLKDFDEQMPGESSSIDHNALISIRNILNLLKDTDSYKDFQNKLEFDDSIRSLFEYSRTNISKLLVRSMVLAIQKGDSRTIEFFLKRSYFSKDFYSEFLVKNNFREEDNLLLTALKKGNHEIIKMLSSHVSLDIVDSYKNNALAIAINLGNAKLAKFIVDENLISNLNQANISKETPYLLALKNSQDELAISIKDKIDPRELQRTNYNFLANIASGFTRFNHEDTRLIQKILDQFPSDESSKIIKDKLMILASKNGNKKMVELLISKGGDVNAVDENGISALQHSVMRKNIGTTQIMLRNSVDINYSNPLNNSAILYAIASQNNEITELLLKSNPNLSMLGERIEVSPRSCFSLLKNPICKITINSDNPQQENQIIISNPDMIKLVRRLMRQPSSQQPSSQSINSSASSLVITTERSSNLG